MSLQREIYGLIKREKDLFVAGMTANEISNTLKISRNTVSHHLNRLVEDNELEKSLGRPVKYRLKERKTSDTRLTLIGKNGSLKSVIQSSIAAVSYPPKGLSVLFKGNSGVGKSHVAKYIFMYCLEKKIIGANRKFYKLNCADYANNPELLSANLFGYCKGAFTGAEKDTKGLLERANGSILFLDEVHRLTPENQEKLFLFMDNGTYSRLGDSGTELQSDVRLIFATTEKIDSVLLTTFRRRISLKIDIPNYQERSYIERLELILSFFKQEQLVLAKDIYIHAEVIDYLLTTTFEGNVGEVLNIIKLMCATAYEEDQFSPSITVNLRNKSTSHQSEESFFYLTKDTTLELFEAFNSSSNPEFIISGSNLNEIQCNVNKVFNSLVKQSSTKNHYFRHLFFQDLENKVQNLSNLCEEFYGIAIPKTAMRTLVELIYYGTEGKRELFTPDTIKIIKRTSAKGLFFANKVYKKSSLATINARDADLVSLLALLFFNEITEGKYLPAVLMSHGPSTAKSIGSLTNRLLGEIVFETMDLDFDSTVEDIISSLKEYLNSIDTKEGLVFVVDMGSLEQLFDPLKRFIEGDLLLINYLSTPLSLDIGLKIQSGLTINELADSLSEHHKIEIKSYQGFAKGTNIIISCISGLGIAYKLKEILHPFFPDTEIITMDYHQLISTIEFEKEHFENTQFVLTTTTIYDDVVEIINIENLISSTTPNKKMLSIIGGDKYSRMATELINFFSIEGAETRLSFLNPKVIIGEMSVFISEIERYFKVEFQNFLKMNLLMHLSLMIERIMIGNQVTNIQETMVETEGEFVRFIRDNSKVIEKKYNVIIPKEEILLIYQIIINAL